MTTAVAPDDILIEPSIPAFAMDVREQFTRVKAHFDEVVNARDYGAAGDGTDATSAFIAAMAAATARGISVVRIPPGNYAISSEIEIPHTVREVHMHGAFITQNTTGQSVFTRYGSVDTVAHNLADRTRGARLLTIGESDALEYSAGDWVLLRSNNLIPTSTAGARISCLRQVQSVGTTVVRVDSGINRTMDIDLSIRKVFLAPSITLYGGTMEHATQTSTAALIKFFLTEKPTFKGCHIGNNGGPAILLIYTVGGSFMDSHVYDLADDEELGYFGYGVCLSGACRGFHYASGTATNMRHAITTVVGTTAPAEFATALDFRGEPEHCVFGPALWAYNTSNLAFDTHEAGYGITIIPHAQGCFGGVNIRSTNTHVFGGTLLGCRREGIRTTLPPGNEVIPSPMRTRIFGTVIDIVTSEPAEDSIGIRLVAEGSEVEIEGVRISGAVIGISVPDDTRAVIRDVLIDGLGEADAIGISIDGQNCDIDGLTVRNANIGILEGATGSGNTWSRYKTESVTTPESRTPTYDASPAQYQAFPGPYANDAAAAAATPTVKVGQAYRRTADNLVVVRSV